MVRITILSILLVAIVATSSEAGWLIYHESKLNGKIIDIDTKQPIEGAVVVVAYEKTNMGLGGGNISGAIKVRETLTDKDGNFQFPSYTAIIQPFSWQIPTTLIIFKPGYASLTYLKAAYFKDEETKEMEGSWPQYPEFKGLKYRLLSLGTVELPKLETREQRLIARRIDIEDYSAKELPLLYKAITEEGKALGIE